MPMELALDILEDQEKRERAQEDGPAGEDRGEAREERRDGSYSRAGAYSFGGRYRFGRE